MNSTMIKIKRILSNRNTVIIICAFIGLLVIYFGYQMNVKAAVKPVKIPYAKVTIQPREKITDDKIGYMKVASAALKDMGKNVITNEKDIIDRYSNINTMIPQGSLFYNGAVVDKSALPNDAVYNVPEGEVLYYLSVNMRTSYVNSIVPDGYIDIYMGIKENGANGKARFGKYIENIKVFAVKTGDGLNVFEDSEEVRTPSYILFSVKKEQYNMLKLAEKIGFEIVPVPINVEGEDIPKSVLTSDEIEMYIGERSQIFEQNETLTQDDETKDPEEQEDSSLNNGA